MRLGKLIGVYCFMYRTTLRVLAKEIGTSTATLSRIQCGEMPSAKVLMALINWMVSKGDK